MVNWVRGATAGCRWWPPACWCRRRAPATSLLPAAMAASPSPLKPRVWVGPRPTAALLLRLHRRNLGCSGNPSRPEWRKKQDTPASAMVVERGPLAVVVGASGDFLCTAPSLGQGGGEEGEGGGFVLDLPPHGGRRRRGGPRVPPRKFDAEKAVQMWEDMLRWRKGYGIDTILEVITLTCKHCSPACRRRDGRRDGLDRGGCQARCTP